MRAERQEVAALEQRSRACGAVEPAAGLDVVQTSSRPARAAQGTAISVAGCTGVETPDVSAVAVDDRAAT